MILQGIYNQPERQQNVKQKTLGSDWSRQGSGNCLTKKQRNHLDDARKIKVKTIQTGIGSFNSVEGSRASNGSVGVANAGSPIAVKPVDVQ